MQLLSMHVPSAFLDEAQIPRTQRSCQNSQPLARCYVIPQNLASACQPIRTERNKGLLDSSSVKLPAMGCNC